MKRGMSNAETCRLNSWYVGTALVGDEGYGEDVIVITAIGEQGILARWERTGHEQLTTLAYREWRKR